MGVIIQDYMTTIHICVNVTLLDAERSNPPSQSKNNFNPLDPRNTTLRKLEKKRERTTLDQVFLRIVV